MQVHTCYGEQLGLTTDDEDYIDPTNFEEREILNSADSASEEPQPAKNSSSSSNLKLTNQEESDNKSFKSKEFSTCSNIRKLNKSSSSSSLSIAKEFSEKNSTTEKQQQQQPPPPQINPEQFPTDMSDSSSDSETGSKMENFVNDAECNSMHEGRQLVHTILPLNIETVFGLLFHKSKFFSEFHRMRKTTNLVQGEWEDQEDGTKKRVQTLTVAITQVVGPKQSHVTETQIMRSCSKPGQLYSIDAISENAG